MNEVNSLDTISLEKILSESRDVIIVHFCAAWSAPSRLVGSILKELKIRQKERIVLFDLDVYKNPDAVEKFHIVGVPIVCVFKDGSEIARYAGVCKQSDYEKFLQ